MKKRQPRGNPQHLPEILKSEGPTTKLVYVYLKGRGEVNYSMTSLSTALGCAKDGVHSATLKLRELGLMEYEGKPRGTAWYRTIAGGE